MFRTSTVLPALCLLASLHAQQGGRGAGAAAQPPGRIPPIEERTAGMRSSTATSRSIGTSAPATSGWRSRASTPTSSTPPASPPDSARTTSASTAGRRAAARSSRSSASAPKVLLVQGNESFRSSSANPAERRSVEDSFAKSVLWGFTVAAESNGRVLVDATDFFAARRPRRRQRALPARPRTASIARAAPSTCRAPKPSPRTPRSKSPSPSPMRPAADAAAAPDPRRDRRPSWSPPPLPRRAHPPADAAGVGGGLFSGTVASVTPTAEAVTLREHYSLVELPDDNYKPRYDDPRAGYGGLSFVDYSTPIGEPMVQALHAPPPPREEGSHRRHQRAGQAHRVLGGSGRARRRAQSARRRRQLVEPGLRSRRLPQRLQGGRAARRRRPHGHPLQHDQLGAPLHARLEHRAAPSPIRAPARSSRAPSRSARCATGRTT